MDANGALDLATSAKQVAQGQMRLHRFGVDLQHLDKDFNRLVGLFVQQEIQALEIGRRQIEVFPRLALMVEPGDIPPRRGRQGQKQP